MVKRGIVGILERMVRRTGMARDVRMIMMLYRFVVPVKYLDLGFSACCCFWSRGLRSVLERRLSLLSARIRLYSSW